MPTETARKYGLIAALVLLSSTLLVYRPERAGLWWEALFEWLHVPVFGLIAITLLALMPSSWQGWRRIGSALAGSVVLALLTEAAQIPMARSASVKDIISDLAGAISFLLAAVAIRSRFVIALPVFVISLAVVYWSASPLIATTQAIGDRNVRFPVIFAGDAGAVSEFVIGQNVQMATDWDQDAGRLFTRTVWPPGQAPSIKFIELFPDWRGHTELKLFIEVESAAPVRLTVRVHDKLHRRGSQAHNDRFNRRFNLDLGFNVVTIPLSEIESAPRGRSMDMNQIDALVVFSAAAEVERVLRIYELRLE